MMPPKVFISHSTRARAGWPPLTSHEQFRDKVEARLRAEGFDVMVDTDHKAGATWRDLIFGRLDRCDAAVVLVNQQALLHSHWVDFELKVLGWRAWMEKKDFRLIIVPFGEVTRRQVSQHPAWEAVTLGEFQMVPSGEGGLNILDETEVDAALAEIVRGLRELPGVRSQKSVYGWLVDKLARLLNLEPAVLNDVAARLGVTPDDDPERLKQEIALRLYALGPKALRTLLHDYRATIPKEDVDAALHILSTYWVDPSASAGILKFCKVAAPRRAFAINGCRPRFTSLAYVRQICCWRDTWPVLTVDDKRSTEDVLEQVRAQLRERFEKAVGECVADGGELDACLNDLLDGRLESEAPVFLALSPTAARDEALVKAIGRTFRSLLIILCTGTAPGGEHPAGFEMLTPEFDLGDERQAWKEYFDALALTTS